MAAQVVPGKVWGVEVPTPAGTNAADVYRKAFDAIDRTKVKDTDVLQCDMRQVVLDEKVKDLLAHNAETIALLRDAAGVKACNWGEVDGDMQKVLDLLNPANTAGRLSILYARQELEDHQPEAAINDWMAAITLARRLGELNLVVSRLAGESIEVSAIKEIAAALPGLPVESRRTLAAKWKALPDPGAPSEWIMGEYAFAKKTIVRQGLGKAWIEILEPFYKTIAAAAGQPPAEFAKVVDAELAKVKLNPFAQTLAPSFKRTREFLAVVEAQRGMLETAITVLEKGKDEVTRSKDPFGEGPFVYRESAKGFELECGLSLKDKPVALRVGGL